MNFRLPVFLVSKAAPGCVPLDFLEISLEHDIIGLTWAEQKKHLRHFGAYE